MEDMEELLKGLGSVQKLEKLKKMLEELTGESVDETQEAKLKERTADNKKMAQTLHLLYAASKVRIYKIADKIASCTMPREARIFPERTQVPIPVTESWKFELGEKVRIKYSVSDFKSIQCRTLGWNARLRGIHAYVGIVTKRLSDFENSVTIYTPARLSSSSLYAGLLEKVSPDENDDPVPSQWEVGQYVTTKMDLKVVQLMQRRLDTIPRRYLGRKGRIIAVTRVAVVVTFNEKTSYDINSYLLMLCPNQSPIEKTVRIHPKGFRVGDRVRMLSNFKKLVECQKDQGGWNESMSNMAGKVVTIINIRKDHTLNVQYKLGRSWRISPDAVIDLNEVQPYGRDDDIQIRRGDIVKIKMVENIRMLLESKNVPMEFLEYIRNTTEVKLVDKDFDYLVRYNCDQNVSAYAQTIRRATEEEIEKHNQVKALVKTMEVGSQVYLDVGPPNFVTSMLNEGKASREVIRALTSPAKLVGYAEDNRAVIEYDDGSRYKVKRKFLTVPDKFNVHDPSDGLDFEIAREIQQTVATCAQIVNEDQARPSSVKILSMSYGIPSTIDLRVHSYSATGQKICDMLVQISDWHIELFGNGVFFINKMESHPHEIKVCLYFNDDEYVPKQISTDSSFGGTKEESGTVTESVTAPAAAGPKSEPEGCRKETEMPPAEAQPVVETVKDFRYLRLFDRSLARNVFFPYVIQGEMRVPQAEDRTDGLENRQGGQNITNIYNINRVENLKSNNMA